MSGQLWIHEWLTLRHWCLIYELFISLHTPQHKQLYLVICWSYQGCLMLVLLPPITLVLWNLNRIYNQIWILHTWFILQGSLTLQQPEGFARTLKESFTDRFGKRFNPCPAPSLCPCLGPAAVPCWGQTPQCPHANLQGLLSEPVLPWLAPGNPFNVGSRLPHYWAGDFLAFKLSHVYYKPSPVNPLHNEPPSVVRCRGWVCSPHPWGTGSSSEAMAGGVKVLTNGIPKSPS